MVILYCLMETFGDWLKHEIELRNMTQRELAVRSGITPAQISRVISGTRGVGEESLLAISRALRLPPETVFRAAGFLPPKSTHNEKLDEALHILSMLEGDDLEEVIQIAKLKLDRKKPPSSKQKTPQKKSRNAPAQTVLKGNIEQ